MKEKRASNHKHRIAPIKIEHFRLKRFSFMRFLGLGIEDGRAPRRR
jgi:hypothetical protein